MKTASGIFVGRKPYSPHARNVFDIAISHRRTLITLPEGTQQGIRFVDNSHVLTLIESSFTEAEFLECPGNVIDEGLIGAAKADYWYQNDKNYDMPEPEFEDECDFDD